MQTDHLLLIVTALAAVVPWAMSIHAKVSSIASSMEGLPELVHETQVRLERHEQAIQTLQKAAASGH
jgi:hypothetical protein